MPPRTGLLSEVRVSCYAGTHGEQRPKAFYEGCMRVPILRILNRELESGTRRNDAVREWFQILAANGQILWLCREGNGWFVHSEPYPERED